MTASSLEPSAPPLPAPLGAGVGATPPSPMSPLDPYPVEPVPPAMVMHTMQCLRAMYDMDEREGSHLEWLMTAGAIRAVDARAVVVSLGIRERPYVVSPTEQDIHATLTAEASQRMPDIQAAEVQTSPSMLFPSMPAMALPPLPAPPAPMQEISLPATLLPAA